jgi:hypothetical protein
MPKSPLVHWRPVKVPEFQLLEILRFMEETRLANVIHIGLKIPIFSDCTCAKVNGGLVDILIRPVVFSLTIPRDKVYALLRLPSKTADFGYGGKQFDLLNHSTPGQRAKRSHIAI